MYAEQEFTAFMDRMRWRAKRSRKWLERERWVEPVRVTRVREYDQETERFRALMSVEERKAS
jgi:hypothetical protein